VLGGNADRLAETERKRLVETGFRAARLRLVGDEDDRLAGLAQDLGEGLIVRGEPRLGVDDEHRDVGVVDGMQRLGAHAALQRIGMADLEAGRVDDVEDKIVKLGGMQAAVARHARRVVDKRELAPGQPVEQRRLADIRTSDDGNGEAHPSPTSPEAVIRSSMIDARCWALRGAVASSTICWNSALASARRPSFHAARPSASRAAWRSGCCRTKAVRRARQRRRRCRYRPGYRRRGFSPCRARHPARHRRRRHRRRRRRLRSVALFLQNGGRAHARQNRIGAVAVGLQRLQRGERLVGLALIGKIERGEEAIAGGAAWRSV
jgi:hypothetical protein